MTSVAFFRPPCLTLLLFRPCCALMRLQPAAAAAPTPGGTGIIGGIVGAASGFVAALKRRLSVPGK